MKRRKILIGAFLAMVVFGAAAVWIYQRYLTPSRLIPVVREAIEEALGQAVDLEEARVVGIGTVAFGRIRIPTESAAPGEAPWFSVPAATVRLEITKLIAQRSLSLEVFLEEPVFDLREDPVLGWNFLRKSQPQSDPPDRKASGEGKARSREGSDLDLRLRMRDPDIRVSDLQRGDFRVRFEEEAQIGFRTVDGEDLKSIRLVGKGRIEGTVRTPSERPPPPLIEDLIGAIGTTPSFDLGLEASLRGEAWEVASRQNPGAILESESGGLTFSRFRFAGVREADNSLTLETAAVESAVLETPHWNHSAIQKLEVPWTEPPRGSFKIGIDEFRFEKDRIRCSLSGIHIEETTLSIEALPWLKTLTPKDGWRMNDIDLSGVLEYSIPDGSIRWSSGKMEFGSGQGGRIETSGVFQNRPQTEWSVDVSVFDFPVPAARIENMEVSPGILSGEMKWVESVPTGSAPVFLAEGSVRLREGEIGAIRLFGGLDDLLEEEGILNSPFQQFGFDFDLKEDRIGITDLLLESEILDLKGNGTFSPGRNLEMDLEIRPSPKLAETLKDGNSRLFASGVSGSKDPLSVRATGSLENPEYSITFGEGMKIPIQGLDIQF